MKVIRSCQACGLPFEVRPQTPSQEFCPSLACQRQRRSQWQKERLRMDPDYRDNQARAQHVWAVAHADYWRAYRAEHPAYSERNRKQQHQRNVARRIAKMDVWESLPIVPSGLYALAPATQGSIAKMDSWIVRITVLARPGASHITIAKR